MTTAGASVAALDTPAALSGAAPLFRIRLSALAWVKQVEAFLVALVRVLGDGNLTSGGIGSKHESTQVQRVDPRWSAQRSAATSRRHNRAQVAALTSAIQRVDRHGVLAELALKMGDGAAGGFATGLGQRIAEKGERNRPLLPRVGAADMRWCVFFCFCMGTDGESLWRDKCEMAPASFFVGLM
jgi:hypothetical protein